MSDLLTGVAWYLVISLTGWLVFPLVYRLFSGLADRGYSLARTAGLLGWGYLFWMLTTLGVGQNDPGGILLPLVILTGLSAWLGWQKKAEILDWLKEKSALVLMVEMVFLLAFAFMCIVRAANPDALGTEKPMELAFINAILRSPSFPPADPWLSGLSISYYYFGYVMAAMLARLTGTAGSVAFNLMLALVFALGASGAYGILHNLLASLFKNKNGQVKSALVSLPWLAPIFLLVNSNLEGFLELLHGRGLFWKFNPDGSAVSAFWKWLDIKDLSNVPNLPLSWVPDRYLWWWRASRVVQDLTLQGAPQELIDEFPFFSFLLGDLHPHVLAIPFGLLAVSVGLNLFLGGWQGETRLGRISIPVHPAGLVFPMLVLGGLAFLNTWDILIGAVIICGGFLLWRLTARGVSWRRLEELLVYSLLVVAGGILLYLPFFIGFKSQAGGILPNLVNPTRGAQLWVMFGGLLMPIFAGLFYLSRKQALKPNWKVGFSAVGIFVVVLWGISWLGGLAAGRINPGLQQAFLEAQGVPDLANLFSQALLRRVSHAGSLITVGGMLALCVGLLIPRLKASGMETQEENSTPSGIPYVIYITLLGGLLVLGPDFLFLRDQFGWRINTIFKFYYQAWLLWSLAAAFGASLLLLKLRGWQAVTWKIILALVLAAGMVYPLFGLATKTNDFNPPFGWSLDGAGYLKRDNPDEAGAIEWMSQAPYGYVAEAVGGSYSNFGRVSMLSGLPAVLGWPGHESQWRGGAEPQGSRQADMQRLYETSQWQEASAILEQYDIRYIYIGSMERSAYRVQEGKFQQVLKPVYSSGNVVIYGVP